MSSKLRGGTLRQLLLGNLLVYLVAGGLAVYFFIRPPADDSEAPTTITGNVSGGPLVNLVLPTPTPFARPAKNVFPSPTAVSLLASTQTNVSAENIGPTPAPQAVTDNSLVPPTALNILLLGSDRRNPGDVSWRTDTIILMSVNQEARSVGLLSIPRDLWVKIPGYGYERINTADFYGDFYKYPGGGQQLIKDVVELNLGIRIHYYARIDMKVFRGGIDTLGGVDVDVTCPVVENGFSDDLGYVNLNFQPGVQHMDGATALRYVRSRYTTSDYDRSRRQRQVMLAAWDKTRQMNLLPKWPELYDQFRSSVKTDLGPTELAALAWIGSQLRPDHIKSRAIDNRVLTSWIGPEGQAVQLLIAQKVHALLVEFFTPPDVRQESASDENASIEVLSGTDSKQTADLAAVALSHQGFNVVSSNVTQTHINATTLVVNHGAKAETVSRLTQLLGIPVANIRTIADPDSHVDLQLILGRDYNPCVASK